MFLGTIKDVQFSYIIYYVPRSNDNYKVHVDVNAYISVCTCLQLPHCYFGSRFYLELFMGNIQYMALHVVRL